MALATRFGRKLTSYRSNSPLDDDQIRTVAPSIFATEAHEARSARYTHIPTSKVLGHLRTEGFQPFFVAQAVTRDESRQGHAKHMIRLRHTNTIAAAEANEIILLNSHDGTSSYQMLAGMLRFVCTNGMVVGDSIEEVRVRHSGNVVDDVIEGAFTVLDQFEEVEAGRDEMKALTMSPDEQQLFAHHALAMRYDEPSAAPITAGQLLHTRRREDDQQDLWTTFNRVQENATRGGQRGTARNGGRTRTRAVKGIDSNLKLNRALWNLAEGLAALKNGRSIEEILTPAS